MEFRKVSDYCIQSDTHLISKFALGRVDAPSIWAYVSFRKKDKRFAKSLPKQLAIFPYGPERLSLSPEQHAAYKLAVASCVEDVETIKHEDKAAGWT